MANKFLNDIGLGYFWTKVTQKITNRLRNIIGGICGGVVDNMTTTSFHDVGDFFIAEEQLYKVTDYIPAGEEVIVGTNVKATDFAKEIKKDWHDKLSWISSAERLNDNEHCLVEEFGDIIFLSFSGARKQRNEDDAILTIPVGYRPWNDHIVVGSIGNNVCLVKINQTGQVYVYATYAGTSTARLFFKVAYLRKTW